MIVHRSLTTLACLLFLCSPALAQQDAVAKLLAHAQKTDGLKRVATKVHFGGGTSPLVTFELRVKDGALRTRFEEWKESGTAELEDCELSPTGQLRMHAFGKRKPGASYKPVRARVEGRELVLRTGKRIKLPAPSIAFVPLPVALFVLPAYYDQLPDRLPFSTVLQSSIRHGFMLVKKEAKNGLQRIDLIGPAGVQISAFVATDGERKHQLVKIEIMNEPSLRLKPAEAEKIRKRLLSFGEGQGPRSAVDALIKACKAKDVDAVSVCFSKDAPGEFQALVKKTCPPKMFAQLCEMFATATVDKVDVEGKKHALVHVTLGGGRKEKINVVLEGETWKVLDF